MNDFAGEISDAVDHAAAPAPSDPGTPAAPGGSGTPGAAPSQAAESPTAAAAGRPGSGRQPSARSNRGAPTRQASDATATPESSTGEPPRERWDDILQNARKTGRSDLMGELGVSDADLDLIRAFVTLRRDIPDLDPSTFFAHARAHYADPVGYYRVLGQQLAQMGLLRDGAPAAPSAPARPAKPEAAWRAPDGSAAFYTAEQLDEYVDAVKADLLDQVRAEIAPFRSIAEEVQAEKIVTEALRGAEEEFAEVSQFEDFDRYRADIAKLMRANPKLSAEQAYNRVHQADLKNQKSRIAEESRNRTLSDIKNAPDPNTARPGRPAPSRAGRSRGATLNDRMDDAIAHAVAQHTNA